MMMRIASVVSMICLSSSLALAKPAVQGATTAPSVKSGASTQASTTSQTTAATKFPTPAELLKKMKEKKEQEAALPKIAYFNLSKRVLEKPAEFSLFGGDNDAITLRSLLDSLRQAREDKDLKGVLITLGADSAVSLAQAQEVRDALVELKKAGKTTYVYADSYDTVGYTLASGASDICMLEGGEILIPGVGIEATFAKGLLDKIGVKADYVQIGEYKGADEQFTRTAPSDELRGELNKLMDAMYAQIVDGLAKQRNIDPQVVKQLIDDAMITGKDAKERGLVDHLIDIDGLRDLMAKSIGKTNGKDINLVRDYGRPAREEIDFNNPWSIFAALGKKPEEKSDKPQIALVYAAGVIVDGDGGEGLFDGGGRVGSDEIRRALRIAARDENIKAVVIRIDSPGGSALASEAMWQAAHRVAEHKPVIVSVGGMAASGGYYLASSAETIFADPSAIVGSIGVVGGKFVLKDLFDKLGISTESFRRGKNADLFSSTQAFTDKQRTMLTSWMKQTYVQFTQRVMSTRTGKIKDIDAVARGRIFVAQQAKELGMVDQIGGLEAALAFAAGKFDLKSGDYDVRVLPSPKTLGDILTGHDPDTATSIRPSIQIGETSILRALPASLQRGLAQQLEILQLLQERPVMLVSPYVISVK